MSIKKIVPFCVETESLTEKDLITLYEWCLGAGAVGIEHPITSLWKTYTYAGVDTEINTYSYDDTEEFNYNLIPFSEVQNHLFGVGETPPETASQPPSEELPPSSCDCINKEGRYSYEAVDDLLAKSVFKEMLSPCVSDAITKYGLVLECSQSDVTSGNKIVYKVMHPFFEQEFIIESVEEFLDLVEGFDILCKYKVQL